MNTPFFVSLPVILVFRFFFLKSLSPSLKKFHLKKIKSSVYTFLFFFPNGTLTEANKNLNLKKAFFLIKNKILLVLKQVGL